MKFARLMSVVLIGVVLSGCASTPKDSESAKVAFQGEVNEKVGDLYYRLTSNQADDEECTRVYRNAYYPERGEFKVYYGMDISSALGATPMVMNMISGKATTDGKTMIIVRDGEHGFVHGRLTRKLISYATTGKCVDD